MTRRLLEDWVDRNAARLMLIASEDEPVLQRSPGEAALLPEDSVSWRVFRNPVSLLIGGIAAGILQLADPQVRAAVDAHSAFSRCPLGRLCRTAHAAMVVVYGARSEAVAMTRRINALHATVRGNAPDGTWFDATDPELLAWVHASASFGLLGAHDRYVAALADADRHRFYAEGLQSGALYGAAGLPNSPQQMNELIFARRSRFEPSGALTDFLERMSALPVLPFAVIQRALVLAAVQLVPPDVRRQLELGARWEARPWQLALVRRLARAVDRMPLPSGGHAQALRRLGLDRDAMRSSETAQPVPMKKEA